MKYRTLADTGTSVSNLALGAMGFGTETEESEAFAILDRFVEAGGNLVDTANVYGAGESESLIGRWFAAVPPTSPTASCWPPKPASAPAPTPTTPARRRNLDRALTASLRRLGLEKVDLYQLHGWDPLTPIEETLRFLDDAVHAGKINYIGLSNFTGWQLQLTLSTAAALGLQLPVTLQPQYSLVCREIEYEVIPAALHNHIGLLPWSPLASGFLTGKYHQGAKPASGARMGSGNTFSDRTLRVLAAKQQNWDTLDAVRDIATSIGATPSQVALSWLTNRPTVTAPIIGGKTLKHLEENLAGADLDLDAASTTRLDDLSAPTPDDYPYGPFGEKQRGRYVDSSDQVIRELS